MSIYDDVAHNIRNDQRPEIDRNPKIDCHGCGDSYSYQSYWKQRYVELDWNPADKKWLCDACIAEAENEYQLYKRGENHRQLTEYL